MIGFSNEILFRSLGLAIPPRIRFLQRMQKDSSKDKDKSAKHEKTRHSKTTDELTAKMLKSKKSSDDETDDNSASEDSNSEEGEDRVKPETNDRKDDNALFANGNFNRFSVSIVSNSQKWYQTIF